MTAPSSSPGSRQHHGATPPPSTRPTQSTTPEGSPANGPTPGKAISNPQMAAMMGLPMGQHSATTALDFNIPADVVVLPSQGLWYTHGKATVLQQNMTSSEENILMDELRIQNRTQWNDLLGALIRDPDFLPAGNLLPADFTRCLLQARINGFGDEYEVNVIDPFTGKLLPAPYNKVHLSEVKNRPLQHRPEADGQFTFELPQLKKKVRFRLLTNDEYMGLLRLNEASTDQKVTNRLYAQITEVDGNNNRHYIHQFSKHIPSFDSLKLRIFMDEVEPALDPTMDFVSSSTGNPTFQSKISLNDSLFYVF